MEPGVLVAILGLAVGLLGEARAEDNRDKVIPEYMAAAMDCIKDYEMDFSVCKEMMKEGTDLSQAKYEPCKCVPACIQKKKKAMTEDGDVDIEQFTKNIDEFGYEPWSQEWKRVRPLCEDSFKGKKNCEAAAAFAVCGWKHSDVLRATIGQYMGQTDDA